MNPWHLYPAFRLSVPFIFGILAGLTNKVFPPVPAWVFFLQVVLLAATIRWGKKRISYANRWIPGIFINLLFLFLGYHIGYQENSNFFSQDDNTSSSFNEQPICLIKLTGPVMPRNKSIKALGELICCIDNLNVTNIKEKVLIYFEIDEKARQLADGDELLVRTRWRRIPGPLVPETFDYATFMGRQGIYRQGYIKTGDWICHAKASSLSVTGMAYQWQKQLVNIIREQQYGKDDEAVGCAMILGYVEGFGQDLQGAYSRAGVTHLLSVSGLHVGLVFIIFNHILFFLNKGRRAKLLKAFLIVLLTWLYAFLTGLSPPVQRAAFMFTFVILGDQLKRKGNIINTLFASILVLLWIEPVFIFNYGFQLTYLAVLGIVILEPIVYEAVYISNKWLDKVWKLLAVTLAAQLATSPLAMYYFHQFPTWFIPANMITIPLSSLVMYLGICLLFVSPVALLTAIVKPLLGWTIHFMNEAVKFTDRLPCRVIEGMYPSSLSVLLFFILTASVVGWINTKEKGWIWPVLLLILGISLNGQLQKIRTAKKFEVVFFQDQKTAWTFCSHNRQVVLFGNPENLKDSIMIAGKLKNYIMKNNIQIIKTLDIRKKRISIPEIHLVRQGATTYFGGKTLCFSSMLSTLDSLPSTLDFLDEWQGTGRQLNNIINTISVNYIIIRKPLRLQEKMMLEEKCNHLKINDFEIKTNGAFMKRW
ncbi:MAG: ComEC/Rec2 family competence protein [Bacteroidetes bacterium]|nr:ComEC/Rec2 family competence protein [Bacteroidota bacterium]